MDDLEGIQQAMEMLSCYLNSSRVDAAKVRFFETKRKAIAFSEEHFEPDMSVDCSEVADPTPATPEEELDSAGLPWDPDKHSKKKTKLKDGTWRPKRGTKTEDEKPVPPPPPADEKGMSIEEASYKGMMDVLKSKGLELQDMNAIAQQVGVQSIALMITKPELIPAVLALAESK